MWRRGRYLPAFTVGCGCAGSIVSNVQSGQAPRARARRDNIGTVAMLAGTAVSALSVLFYQPVAGRALGTDGFAPIAVIWTTMFFIYTVLMVPVEQFITRRIVVTGGGSGWMGDDRKVVGFILGSGWLIGTVFVAATLGIFFNGEPIFVVLTAVLLVSRGVLAVGRGMLAGHRRFVAYGGSLAAEALSLVVLAVIASVVSPTTLTFAWTLVLGPLSVLAFRPWKGGADALDAEAGDERAASFLGWLVMATVASQIVIASGPIVVGLIGGTATAVSIVFATFTLFRGPVTSAYNLVARVLPNFTELSEQGKIETLAVWRHRIAVVGCGLAILGAVAAYLIGPWIVGLLYGHAFEPPRMVAALGGAGVGAGLGALFVGQIFIASGRTRGLAGGWALALLLAAAAVFALPVDPMLKISWGFAVGEIAALIILGFAPRRRIVEAP